MSPHAVWNLSLPAGFERAEPPQPAILVVDDREENLFAMRKLLSKLDAEIVTAASGPEALAQSLRQEFALILLDVQMPSMNGFEVAQCLRDNEETAHVPIIFLTAISKEERFVFQGYDSGAVDYVFKPVDPAILLAKARVFLDLARQRESLRHLTLVLTELNERHMRLLEAMHEGVIGFSLDGQIQFANPMAQRLLGAPNRLVGDHIVRYVTGADPSSGEWEAHPLHAACLTHRPFVDADTRMYRADGQMFPAEISFGPLGPDSGPTGGVLVFSDISARKRIEEALRRQATFDQLTGIPNRALFYDELSRALARARRAHRPLALMYLDLDGFKTVNDTHGHAVGDRLLCAFCERSLRMLREGDLMARIGGDEFVVLVEDAPDPESLQSIANKLCQAAREPFDLDGIEARIAVSLGIAITPRGAHSPDELVAVADSAMYEAKQARTGGWRLRVLDDADQQPVEALREADARVPTGTDG